MTVCSSCEFIVDEQMKFALINNICPKCGSSLFSQDEMSLINGIQARIQVQEFSLDFTKEMIYGLALFVFSEVQEYIPHVKSEISKEPEGPEELETSEELKLSEEEGSLDDIRKQIEGELEGEISKIVGSDEGEASDDDKYNRLKNLHSKQRLQVEKLARKNKDHARFHKKKAIKVRRASD